MKSAVGEDWQEGWFLIRKIMEIIIAALEGVNGRVAQAHQPSPTFRGCRARPREEAECLGFVSPWLCAWIGHEPRTGARSILR